MLKNKYIINIIKLVFAITIYLLLQSPASAQFKSANNFVSQEQTVNGFSNFFLGVNYAEPFIATNPRDPLNTICSFIYSSYLTLDGLNWSRLNSLNSGDPFLAFDSIGNAYYTPAPPWSGGNLGVLKSTDKGITWSNSYLIYSGVTDKPCICGNQSGGIYSNYLYSAWQSSVGEKLSFARSTNQGVNWSSMSLGVPTNYYCPYLAIGPSPAVPGGIVYYGINTYSPSQIKIKKSTDGGISFSPDIFVSTFIDPPVLKNGTVTSILPCIQMSADNGYSPNRGNVYIVYTGRGAGTDKADIFFVKSTNYGDNWSVPLKLNDDNTSADQWMPAISVDNNGKIYVIWYDSRIDPQNYMTLLYGTVSTNGGASFVPDFPVSTTPFNPSLMVVNGFMGHYISVSAIGNTALASWTDGRNNNFGSYVGFVTDFAMTASPLTKNLTNNDSLMITVKIPEVKGPYNGRINFSCQFDTLPATGNINLSFLNGKDFITTIPDSVKVKVLTSASVTPGLYKLNIIGRSQDGVPVHQRTVSLLVNYSSLSVGTNRNDTVMFKVNGMTYTRRQELFVPNNTTVSVQALSPFTLANKQFIYTHWSDMGDTSHTVLLNNSSLVLTAIYRLQLKLNIVSSQGSTFGGNVFYDSGAAATIGVNSRIVINGNTIYSFKGWQGTGNGSYTSPDSTGLDSVITIANIINPVTETARWVQTTGVNNISSNIPEEYKLYNNYPNPFNPSTKIRFDIPVCHSGEGRNPVIKLIIYDALGRQVETLINQQMNAGSYIVDFNGVKLASGIYFCRLISAGFNDIKRLVLLK
ncbi:MAG: T9SS type A sorting domain-containing protein [Ignavibacteriae bacterium]|nr:T9SS type A sorting domain-containing protein [Ignavibacteriota bacterium]